MKFYALLAVLTLTSALNTVSAADMNVSEDDNYGYCAEQAAREGIENESEKALFINECIESFKAPGTESEPAGK